MSLGQRGYAGPADQGAMGELVEAHAGENLHVVDLPYRFSSWAFDEPRNVGLWAQADGQLVAWAVLQTPFWAIDYAYAPTEQAGLHAEILAWADEHARAALGTAHGHPAWYVNVFADQTERIADLEQAGFRSQAEVGEDAWSKVLMARGAGGLSGRTPLPLPPGFSLRPLRGEAEVAAYVELHRAVFESKSMTVEWRARTLRQPGYRPELDLVAAAPDGRLAAFCVGWFNPNGMGVPSGQIEPMGVHADFRQMGLGRAILSEALRRLEGCGARRIYVETDSYRNAAFELYGVVGFRVSREVLVYRKDYE